MTKRKGFYSISVVSKMFSIHQQTIRMYEKEGLITPMRSDGNTRLFSEDDVERLEEIINLTHNMGVNLKGVEVILKLQKKVSRMQSEMNKLFKQLQGQLDDEGSVYKNMVKKQAEQLGSIKQESALSLEKKKAGTASPVAVKRHDKKPKQEIKASEAEGSIIVDDTWEVDYEDSN
jgi:MerR family transcriptional regulator/heat shock protein HspR